MTQVNIENIGSFYIPNEKTEELTNWINKNDGVKTKSSEEELSEQLKRITVNNNSNSFFIKNLFKS
jgi:hypothetical protein